MSSFFGNALFGRIAPFLGRRFERWITVGQLTLVLPNDDVLHLGPGGEPHAKLNIHSWKLFRHLVTHGGLGFADAYLLNHVDVDDLQAFFEFVLENNAARKRKPLMGGSPWGRRLAKQNRLRPRRNTKEGARRNIVEHYDLGNAFYALWLDESMTYSSALFEDASESLEKAQLNKLDRLIEQADIQVDHHVVEIGCGWGSFMERAVTKTECRATGITISDAQLAYTQQRLSDAGLSDRAQVELRDYRDLPSAQFDRAVSIEMFEAVGEEYWSDYFETLHRCLKPEGRAALQIIAIDEKHYDRYRHAADFIQAYIFPGGMLATPSIINDLAKQANFEIADDFRFAASYAQTLNLWKERFIAAWPQIEAPQVKGRGFDQRFYRMWIYYLDYCAVGFAQGHINVVQFTLVKRSD